MLVNNYIETKSFSVAKSKYIEYESLGLDCYTSFCSDKGFYIVFTQTKTN